MALRILVADDEAPICNLITNLINEFEDCEVVASTIDSSKIMTLVAQHQPDIVFTDINMPDMDGLSLVHRLKREHPEIGVVFVSGHSNFAADAFNLDVVDFVVKPISRTRLETTIAKIIRFKGMIGKNGSCKMPHKLTLKNGHGLSIVDIHKILFIEKCGNKCIIHTSDGTYETSETLTLLEKKLNGSGFFRCHKSFLINIDNVKMVSPYADRAYEVKFHDYQPCAAMRRDKFEELAILMNL